MQIRLATKTSMGCHDSITAVGWMVLFWLAGFDCCFCKSKKTYWNSIHKSKLHPPPKKKQPKQLDFSPEPPRLHRFRICKNGSISRSCFVQKYTTFWKVEHLPHKIASSLSTWSFPPNLFIGTTPPLQKTTHRQKPRLCRIFCSPT